jgi:isoleucyl-tRNA synthetase
VSPFVSELIWKELHGENRQKHGAPLSVHMTEFPRQDESLIDLELEKNMDLVEKVVSLGRAARSRKNLKVRQPLSQLLVKLPGDNGFERLSGDLVTIKDELNIKDIVPAADLDQYVTYSAKLNFKVAGPKLGKHVKTAAGKIGQLTSEQVRDFVRENSLSIESDGERFTLTDEDVEVSRIEKEGFAVESDATLTIALVTDITEELRDEGFARELVNKIQNMRKKTGLEVTDHIAIQMCTGERLRKAADRYTEFIRRETLANRIDFLEADKLKNGTEWDINGEKAALAVTKE